MTIRFDDTRRLIAKYAGECSCGRTVNPGDSIGYGRESRYRGASRIWCNDCYTKWESENAEADLMESLNWNC